MIVINLNKKPLSVNEAWKGRKFKTDDYRRFEKSCLVELPKIDFKPLERIKLALTFGFSSSRSDIDNPVKPILDILCKKYGFDDRQIYELNVKKHIVKKGNEFILIKIENYE